MTINSIGFGCGYCSQAKGYLQLTGVPEQEAEDRVNKTVDGWIADSEDQLSHQEAAKLTRNQMRNVYYIQRNIPRY